MPSDTSCSTTLGVQPASCRHAASAMGPNGQWGATATSWHSANAAIRRHSLIPPAWLRSGWMISTSPLARTGRKSQREYSRSPSAIGVVTWAAIPESASQFSESTGSSMNISPMPSRARASCRAGALCSRP